ncbi:MAG: transglutaminase domain-containing protein [Bacteroidales bacterium]|nr:transglutaminase domain-containing protein [Bacteroidales bacterium]
MNAKRIAIFAAALSLLAACNRDPHFISDADYRAEVQADFEGRRAQFPMLDLRLDTLCTAEREAMEFLYAYMPLSDLADYPAQFYLDQVRTAFRARSEMAWGKRVPEDVFRHFVLVYRVNNENLDTARQLMFRELKERVQGMTMEQAALEVNHWCHEHVAYRASDGRTSAPLATMRTSLGRCGEESTFAVTALRSVGIPARQCYTPRWAHCDDNHAWVEVWVDGEWKFCGACEPDPRLDMGWFSIPSTRCMMVHSKAFGKYKGDEEVVRRTGLYSELNLLSHYAPTRRVTVTVLDAKGQPLPGAQVKFKLYNYAEYYTLSSQPTDARGAASLTTGLGDLLVWATDGSQYAYSKLDVRTDSTLTLTLGGDQAPIDILDIVPPAAGEPKVVATEAETAANARRLAYEDSVRNAYTATFPTKDSYKRLMKPNANLSDRQAWEIIRKSEGNYAEIIKFLDNHSTENLIQVVYGANARLKDDTLSSLYDYLSTFSDKDLRDITAEVLESHWAEPTMPLCVDDYKSYKQGLMPARISNEMVRPYRAELASFAGKTADEIRDWTLANVAVDDTCNYYNCPVSPVGVYRLRHADRHSRDIFFVAACRAADVPAYLDNATGIVYVWDGKRWAKSGFADDEVPVSSSLTLTYKGSDPAKPVYWPHFTLAKLQGGDLRTFDFEDDPRMASFPATISLEPGTYCLSTGNRYPDGSVRSRLEFFEVKDGGRTVKEIVILPLIAKNEVLGQIDPSLELFDGATVADYAGAEGMLYVNLGDYSEPSKHLVVELRGLQKEMRQWGGMTLMVGPSTVGMAEWGLVNTDLAYRKGQLEERLVEALGKGSVSGYPLVALVDRQGNILYHSEGYKIGVVEQVLKRASM